MKNNAEASVSDIQEKSEGIPSSIKVFLVRHGETRYLEHSGQLTEEDIDLTDQGVEQIKASAQKILERIDKEKDIVWVIHSPRKRAKHSADIIKELFKQEGIEVWEDPKNREEQSRVSSVNLRNDDGSFIHPGENGYEEKWANLLETIGSITAVDGGNAMQAWKSGKADEQMEDYASVSKRANQQLKFFLKLAHLVQPKVDKNIVLIEIKHEETLDPLYSVVSSEKWSAATDNGPKKGELVQLEVSTSDNSVRASFLDRENSPTFDMQYNPKKNKLELETQE